MIKSQVNKDYISLIVLVLVIGALLLIVLPIFLYTTFPTVSIFCEQTSQIRSMINNIFVKGIMRGIASWEIFGNNQISRIVPLSCRTQEVEINEKTRQDPSELLANHISACWSQFGSGNNDPIFPDMNFLCSKIVFSSNDPEVYIDLMKVYSILYYEKGFASLDKSMTANPYEIDTSNSFRFCVQANDFSQTTIPSVNTFNDISVGQYHACGLLTDGRAVCWGNNDYGQLGNGQTIESKTPVHVFGDYNFSSISAGISHNCGLLLDGSAVCWGLNTYGQLGNGGNTNSYIPVFVVGDYNFSSISAGGYHTCGILTDGRAVCWGGGYSGALGNGLCTIETDDYDIEYLDCEDSSIPVFIDPSQDLRFKKISTGLGITTGILVNDKIVFFGNYKTGTIEGAIPTNESISYDFMDISSRYALNTCGVLLDGRAVCWGLNTHGQLGIGLTTTNLITDPSEASDFVNGGSTLFSSITNSQTHACGLLNDGSVMCWGQNDKGQLGIGSNSAGDTRTLPTAVAGGHVFTKISTRGFHTCGLLTDGSVMCWGQNNKGQLGNGGDADSNVPVSVSTIPPILKDVYSSTSQISLNNKLLNLGIIGGNFNDSSKTLYSFKTSNSLTDNSRSILLNSNGCLSFKEAAINAYIINDYFIESWNKSYFERCNLTCEDQACTDECFESLSSFISGISEELTNASSKTEYSNISTIIYDGIFYIKFFDYPGWTLEKQEDFLTFKETGNLIYPGSHLWDSDSVNPLVNENRHDYIIVSYMPRCSQYFINKKESED